MIVPGATTPDDKGLLAGPSNDQSQMPSATNLLMAAAVMHEQGRFQEVAANKPTFPAAAKGRTSNNTGRRRHAA